MAYHVFISYRRQGASELALLLHARLAEKGYSPFLDMEGMRAGSFNSQLYERIDECDDVLVLLPEKGLDPTGRDEDWFRLEIAYALKKGKNVIPVMMRGFEWPKEKDPVVEQLHYRQGLEVSTEYFDAMFAKLCGLITYKPGERKKHLFAVIAAAAAFVLAVGYAVVFLCGLNGTKLENMYVQAIRDCWLYETVDDADAGIAEAAAGEVFIYNSMTEKDGKGVSWYAVDCYGASYWISSKDGNLTTGEKALKNHPSYFKDYIWSIEEECSRRRDEETGEWVYVLGCNDQDEMVDWIVECYYSPFSDASASETPEVVSCSWTKELLQGGDMSGEMVWQALQEGNTVTDYDDQYTWPADIDELESYRMVSRVYLPDDPDIEGRQSITYRTGSKNITFTFDLVYAGGYTGSGHGWKAENIEVSR